MRLHGMAINTRVVVADSLHAHLRRHLLALCRARRREIVVPNFSRNDDQSRSVDQSGVSLRVGWRWRDGVPGTYHDLDRDMDVGNVLRGETAGKDGRQAGA